jgi:hypothetical protein
MALDQSGLLERLVRSISPMSTIESVPRQRC